MRNLPAVLPGTPFAVERLLAPDAAVARFLGGASLRAPAAIDVGLDDAWDRVLAGGILAREAHPTHARSTMDGYAVRATDRGPRRVVGEIRMGRPPARGIALGEAMTIPTGGALPSGADAVVPLEDAVRDGVLVVVADGVTSGACNTLPGEDMRAGERMLAAGRRLGGAELGVLATLGYSRVPVFARPRIAVVSTGDEVIAPEAPLRAGTIRDANRWAIAGALRAFGCTPVHLPHVPDEAGALRDALAAGLAACDGVVLSGGSSVGERDLVPRVVATLGAPGILVHGLRVKPGKPTLLAAVDGKPVIGLPGNPASALMILEAVLGPIIRACTGERRRPPLETRATATAAFVGRPEWTWFVPARLSFGEAGMQAEPLVLRSAASSLLARASGYVVLGPERARIEAGEPATVRRFSGGGA